MDGRDVDEPRMRISISPEPTDEEAAAIAAAVTILVSARAGSQAPAHMSEERWKAVGRREAMRTSTWPPEGRHEHW